MRKRTFASILYKFFTATDDRRQWSRIKDMVDERNVNSLQFFSVLFTVVLSVVSVGAIFIPSMKEGFYIYVFTLGVCVLMLIFTQVFVVRKKLCFLALPVLYIMLFLSFVFGIAIGTRWNNPMPAVTFVVFLVISPLMICDKPWRIDTAVLLVVGIFIYIDRTHKPDSIFFFDLMNTVAFYIISIVINSYNQGRYVKEFSSAQSIAHQRDTDSLSGVMTKRAFELYVRRALLEPGIKGVLMIIDIDNFKRVNDTLGHARGDEFIAKTGTVLRSLFRQTDRIGRFGGDEFVIFVSEVVSADVVMQKANEVRTTLRKVFSSEMNYSNFSVSIGCTFFSGEDNYDSLFLQMDGVLYEAKRSGKDRCKIFEKK